MFEPFLKLLDETDGTDILSNLWLAICIKKPVPCPRATESFNYCFLVSGSLYRILFYLFLIPCSNPILWPFNSMIKDENMGGGG